MSVLPAGSDVPEFTLRREDGEPFTRDDLAGKTTVLVFYPAAFSSVCTDQFQIYQEVLEDLAAQGADLYGVSIDQTDSQVAFRESLGVTIPMLSDAVPQAAATRAFGVLFEPTGVVEPRARHRRPRPDGAVVLGGRAPGHPAGREPHLRRPGRRRRRSAAAAVSGGGQQRRDPLRAEVEDRLDVAAHEQAVGERAERPEADRA